MKELETSINLHDELISAINNGCGSLAQKGLARNAVDGRFISLNGPQMGPDAHEVVQEGWKTITCLAPWAEKACIDWVERLCETASWSFSSNALGCAWRKELRNQHNLQMV